MTDKDGAKLLSGGNPQIPKGDGDAPVEAYLDAMPGWKQDIGKALDALIVKTLPDVKKAVRWNSPFYGIDGESWIVSFHCMTKYIKVTFLNGGALSPPPPVTSKYPDVRYYHIREGEEIDAPQFTNWVMQASRLPGERLFKLGG